MNRALALLLALLLIVPTAAIGTAAQASIADVTVSPSQPGPDERITVTTTIRNAQGGSTLNVTDVAVRTASGRLEELARVENLGSVPAGSEMRVPLSFSFDEAGVQDLRVIVYGNSEGRPVELRYPLSVTVRDSGPRLSIDARDPVVGAEGPVSVTVANGEDAAVRNLELSVAGEDASVEETTRLAPALAGGQSQQFVFNVTPAAESSRLTATLRYTTPQGENRLATVTRPLSADLLRADVGIEASVPTTGPKPPVNVELTNFGNAALRDVVVRAEVDGDTVSRRLVGDVPATTTRAVQMNVTGVEAADLTLVAAYLTAGESGEVRTDVPYRSNPGRIELTGVDIERENDRLHLSGSASNVGLSDARSVVVSVVPGDGVTPARPYKEYFVGTVPASDFVSFDLYAQADAGATTIPIRVTYLVDGEQESTVTDVAVDDLPTADQPQSSPTPSLPVLVGGVVAALLVVGISAFAYLRR
ncbi:MAG: hypothetical protein ACQETI_01615 [Halobacteriota archaeon]